MTKHPSQPNSSANRAPTAFEEAVYAATRAIPPGKVSTYGGIAARIGRGTARAVGCALARNPFAPEVPCHRVVRADGSLGGFNGATTGPEPARKRRMLQSEQVPFLPDGRIHPDAIL
jgi:methylated-DNA-[protein]-cysteine S-methyltransferase